MGPALLGSASTQINILVNTNFAAALRDASGMVMNGPVSWLNYAFRFMQFPLGVFGVAIAAATLPEIARSAARSDFREFRQTLSRSLSMVMLLTIPSSVGLAVLGPSIANIVSNPRGDLLTFGILFAIWSASSGVEALRLLLNRCYAVPETRSVILLRLQSVVLVVLSAIAIAIMSLAIVLAPVIERLLAHYHFAILLDRNAWFRLRYGAVIPTTMIVLVALHLLLPNRPPRFGEIWPGTLITAVLWITGAAGFSIYVDNLTSYNVTYGALGGIVLSLLFFYVAAIIFGFGAEMNAAIMRRLSPIAPAPVGDMRHAIEPAAGHRQPADSVLTGDQMAGKPREPGT